MKKSMELRHLRYFVAVAEELHFNRAAERLHISQPPLSQQIHHLEEDLGVQLFDRDKHHVVLTEAGRAFLDRARGVLEGVEAAKEAARHAARDEQRRLRVAVSMLFDVTTILRMAEALSAHELGIELEAPTIYTGSQAAEMLAGRVDAAIATPPPERPDSMVVTRLASLRLELFVPARHRLARHRSIALDELGTEPLVWFPREANPIVHDQLWRRFQEAGYKPARIHRVQGGLQVSAALIREGLGVAFFPAWMGETLSREIRTVPLASPGLEVECGLLMPASVSPALRALQEVALAHAGPTPLAGHLSPAVEVARPTAARPG